MDIEQVKGRLTAASHMFKTRFQNVPMGWSKCEIDNLIVNKSLVPEKAYKQLGTRLDIKIGELEILVMDRRETDVDIEEMRAILMTEDVNPVDKKRISIQLEKKAKMKDAMDFAITDMMNEISYICNLLNQFPLYTAEDLEKGEKTYLSMKHALKIAVCDKDMRALDTMGASMKDLVGVERTPVMAQLPLLQKKYEDKEYLLDP